MPPMDYQLTLVTAFEDFGIKQPLLLVTFFFGHQIMENNDGSVTVKHSVSLDSEDKQHLDFLRQVFSDVPNSIFILKELLER